MTEFHQLFSSLREQASASLHRSDVLKPLAWLIGMLVLGSLASAYHGPPEWLTVLFAVSAGLAIFLYVGAYLFCLLTDKDALRSERHSIQKFAIQNGLFGDSTLGIIDVPAESNQRSISESGHDGASEDKL